MKILGKRILVRPHSAETTKGGLVIPEKLQESDQEGVVMAIGNGITESREYRKGSTIFIEMYQAKPLVVDGVEMFLVEQKHVIGVMVDGAFHPIGDRLLLKTLPSHAGRIIRPSAYERDADEILYCTVHLVGSGIRTKSGGLISFEVSKGDTVAILPTAGRDVDSIEGTYKLVRHSEIIGKVEK